MEKMVSSNLEPGDKESHGENEDEVLLGRRWEVDQECEVHGIDGAAMSATRRSPLAPSTSTNYRPSAGLSTLSTHHHPERSTSTWSSTSFPLRNPQTPPVMRKVPAVFIRNLLNKPVSSHEQHPQIPKSTPSIVCLAKKRLEVGERVVGDRDNPRRTPEVGYVPVGMRGGGVVVVAERETMMESRRSGAGIRSKVWRHWPTTSSRKMDASLSPEGVRRKGVTPPRISVRNLIARWRVAESEMFIAPDRDQHHHHYDDSMAERVEVELKARKGEQKPGERSLSIKTFRRSFLKPGVAKSASFTFVAEEGGRLREEVSCYDRYSGLGVGVS